MLRSRSWRNKPHARRQVPNLTSRRILEGRWPQRSALSNFNHWLPCPIHRFSDSPLGNATATDVTLNWWPHNPPQCRRDQRPLVPDGPRGTDIRQALPSGSRLRAVPLRTALRYSLLCVPPLHSCFAENQTEARLGHLNVHAQAIPRFAGLCAFSAFCLAFQSNHVCYGLCVS